MKQTSLIFAFLLPATFSFAQKVSEKYIELIKVADSLYNAKNFKKSAEKYSEAFKSNGWKGVPNDRYNAACCWAMASVPDSAFFQLNRIATLANYKNYGHIITDPELNSLHSDSRWEPLIEKIKENKNKAEANLNKPLVAILDSIYFEDQKYRLELDEIEKKYGWESKEIQNQWKIINKKDSINLIKVKAILDKYGWLGADVIGDLGNSTLFLVIQHSDQTTQEKYLPLMRDAVKNGKAPGSSLALLEDRVALGQGKRQTYGSQIGRDPNTQAYYVLPLDDPDNVDKRRAEVGLGPLAEYVNYWQIKWDAKQYKKDLPELEKKNSNKQVAEKRTEAQAKKLADSIYIQLKKGVDFKVLANKYSGDPGTNKIGGVYSPCEIGTMDPDFENVILKLKVKEISKPFKTSFGYHIAQLLAREGNKYQVRHILITFSE